MFYLRIHGCERMCFKNLPGVLIGQDLVDPLLGRVELLLPPAGHIGDDGPAGDGTQVPEEAAEEDDEEDDPHPERYGLGPGEAWLWIVRIHTSSCSPVTTSIPGVCAGLDTGHEDGQQQGHTGTVDTPHPPPSVRVSPHIPSYTYHSSQQAAGYVWCGVMSSSVY